MNGIFLIGLGAALAWGFRKLKTVGVIGEPLAALPAPLHGGHSHYSSRWNLRHIGGDEFEVVAQPWAFKNPEPVGVLKFKNTPNRKLVTARGRGVPKQVFRAALTEFDLKLPA